MPNGGENGLIISSLTHFMRDTILGLPLGKQFCSRSRPHIVGTAPRVKLFATRTIFLTRRIFAANEKIQNGRNITKHTMGYYTVIKFNSSMHVSGSSTRVNENVALIQ